MKIDSIRVYAEVLEQGIDFKEYLKKSGYTGKIANIYTKKIHGEFSSNDSLISRIRKVKDVDVLITAISDGKEYPLLAVEYSTAVPTDDHKMQRSDVYFWGAKLHLPIMKISPDSKGMGQDFGGGSNITDDFEIQVAYRNGGIFYPIKWLNDEDTDILITDDDHLSCINYSKEIESILQKIRSFFESANDFDDFYDRTYRDYQDSYDSILKAEYTIFDVMKIIKNSSRFEWDKNNLTIKINRFGHAMDPDRGVLYFANMLVGAEHVTTEIQVNRPDDFNARGGYKSLFDASPREKYLATYVNQIISQQNNVFTDANALHVLLYALCIENAFAIKPSNTNNHKYTIGDDELEKFLLSSHGITSKCIFFLTTGLKLTDKNRNVICEISWNKQPIEKYFEKSKVKRFVPTTITELSSKDMQEDIVTFASVELYRRMRCNLLAVSYPGAQGDKCILEGSGRKVERTYVDIIAYKDEEKKIRVFLEECKDTFSKSKPDVEKLSEIKTTKMDGLVLLFNKVKQIDNIDETLISIGAKATLPVPSFDVDYIFMFDVDSSGSGTDIYYTVALINLGIVNDFKALLDTSNKLRGKIHYDKIYRIA